MSYPFQGISRRSFLSSVGALGVATQIRPQIGLAASQPVLLKAIPASGEQIPAVGMGTWITFNVGDDKHLRDQRLKVMKTFFELGGALIDSSPMYGSSEAVVGYCLERLKARESLFSATKVWILSKWLGIWQMNNSYKLWGEETFDLLQIHNLLDWKAHLKTLLDWKSEGRVRYIGITTSHGRRHDDFAKIMSTQPVDFVQFTYNILDREAEKRLLPLAADQGKAVIINRPFQGGSLFEKIKRHPLPEWAAEFDCGNWAQFLLKFIVSHPAVTCAIPATTRVDHMGENMGAAYGRLPDPKTRQRMVQYVENL